MSSKLEDLIAKLCPNGVEYHSLEELFVIKNGYTPSKSNSEFWTDGTVPWFRMDDIRAHGRVLSDSIQHVTKSAVKSGKLFPANSIILATTATIGEHALVIVDSLANQRFTFFSKRESLGFDLDMKYVFYYFFIIDEWCKRNVNAASFASVDMPRLRKLKIPVPPLEVQREIVRILDSFTELTAELIAELTARKKQYEYYRDYLLTHKTHIVENKKISDIAENFDSLRKPVTSGNREAGEYPYYGASGIVDYVSDYIFDGDYLLVSEDGANLLARSTPIAFSISGKNWVNNHAHVLRFETYATRRYVEFYLNSIDLSPWISGGAQPKLNQKNLNKINIPLPSLAEQKRIVGILDRFDALCNDLSSGLPAEIEARQKQYEFYRDKLLSFKQL